MEIKWIPIDQVKPYERNAKKHPEEQIQQIANSLKEFGWQQPIVLDENGVVVIGHGRLLAAKRLGHENVPVIYAEGLTKKQIKALRLADNRISQNGEFDSELLHGDLSELIGDFNMLDFGFSEFDLDINNQYVDDFFESGAETREKTKVYGVKVVCGTQEQVDEIMQLLKNQGYSPEEL